VTAIEKLRDIYREKRDRGLVHVSFSLTGGTPAQIAEELVAMQEAIDAGHTTELDFGDLRWKEA